MVDHRGAAVTPCPLQNLLYIQNLTQDNNANMCFGWAWYLVRRSYHTS